MTIPHLIIKRWPFLAVSKADGGPCDEAVAWLCSLQADTTWEHALRLCPKPEWLAWLAVQDGQPVWLSVVEMFDFMRREWLIAVTALKTANEERAEAIRERAEVIRKNIHAAEDAHLHGEPVGPFVASALFLDEGVSDRIRSFVWGIA